MSGPVSERDVEPVSERDSADPPEVELTDSREAMVGEMRVRRALPRRTRRTVGAWCFADHMGPADVTEERGIDIGRSEEHTSELQSLIRISSAVFCHKQNN